MAAAWRKMLALSLDLTGIRGTPSLWTFAFKQPVLPIILGSGFLAVALGAFVVIYGTVKNKKAS